MLVPCETFQECRVHIQANAHAPTHVTLFTQMAACDSVLYLLFHLYFEDGSVSVCGARPWACWGTLEAFPLKPTTGPCGF